MNYSEWSEETLGNIVEIIGGGTPKTSVAEYWYGDIPWLSVVDFGGDKKYVSCTEKNISQAGVENSSTRILKKGQLIISARGTVGELAILERDMAFNQSCYGLQAKEQTTNDFLYYLIQNSLVQLKSKTHGAVFDTITRETFNHINISLPNKTIQQKIASILSSLDDKIELNRQTNKTLENIAQVLFDELLLLNDLITTRIGDLITYIVDNRGKTPPLSNEEKFCPLIEVNALVNSNVTTNIYLSRKYVSEDTYNSWFRKGHPKNNDILFSTVGSIGEVSLVFDEKIAIAQNIISLRSEFGPFLYFYLKNIKNELLSLDVSSVQPSIKVPHLLDYKISIPDKKKIIEFQKSIQSILELILNNSKHIQTLIRLRDSLLPKLMKGEIEIK